MPKPSLTAHQKPKWWQITLIAMMVFFLTMHPFREVRVEGRSMEPHYHPDEIVWCVMPITIHPGDVVVVRTDEGDIIKRAAYVGGERFLAVNVGNGFTPAGRIVGWRAHATDPGFFLRSHAQCKWFTVPQNTVFLLGDNLDASQDSRAFGPVPTSSVEGIVL